MSALGVLLALAVFVPVVGLLGLAAWAIDEHLARGKRRAQPQTAYRGWDGREIDA